MKLFVLRGVYWYWVMRPKDSSGKPFSTDPLDEHHTYFYYHLLKSNVVDEVIIYSDRKENDEKQKIPPLLNFPEGKMRIIYNFDFKEVHESKGHLIYCRDQLSETNQFPQHRLIAKSVGHGFPNYDWLRWIPFYIPRICRPLVLNKKETFIHLTEGPYNQRFTSHGVKSFNWPSLSNQAQYIDENTTQEKKYDWIYVASVNPRKRVLEFMHLLVNSNLKGLRGALLLSTKERKNSLSPLEAIRETIKKDELNITIYTNVDCKSKMSLLKKSKVFISAAAEDSGPRVVIEAGQAKIPILALKHHGSASLLVKNGINGEITWLFKRFPKLLKKILNNYDDYDCSVNDHILDEKNWIKPIVKYINHNKHD